MYTAFVIMLIASAMLFSLLFADMLTENDHHTSKFSAFVFAEWLLSASIIALSIGELSSFDNEVAKIQETTIIEFVDDTVSYDTLAMDKNGKLLKIELKKND